ncbi:hypothetical protein [Methanobrevibacter sp.]
MIDKTVNYNKYYLNRLQDFEETTILNPDLNGAETPKLKLEKLNIKKRQFKRIL